MKRVLFISDIGSPWGGSEELWSKTAIELKKENYEVHALVNYFNPYHLKIEKLLSHGIIVRFRKNKIRDWWRTGLEKLDKPIIANYLHTNTEKVILELAPDLVIFSQSSCYSAYKEMLFCHENKISYCSISQLNTEFSWPNDNNFRNIQKAFLNAKSTFFVSKGNLDLFQTQIACKLNNAHVISNPFNLDFIPNLEWPKEEKVSFAYVARLAFNHKGTDILLRAFSQPQWKNRNFELNIYGGGDISLAKETAKFLGTYNINFKGHVDSIENIWKKNHALVLPSRYEGMPLSILEAMLCSRIVITTDVAGHKEYIEDGETGFLAEAPKLDLFSIKLEQAWKKFNDWPEIGKRAKKKVQLISSNDPVGNFKSNLIKFLETPYEKVGE